MKKREIFFFILGALIFGTIGVAATTLFVGSDISYDKSKTNLNSDNVQDAIDEMYDKVTFGDATAGDILNGKTALVNGNKVTGNLVSSKNKYEEVFEILYMGQTQGTLYLDLSKYDAICIGLQKYSSDNSYSSTTIDVVPRSRFNTNLRSYAYSSNGQQASYTLTTSPDFIITDEYIYLNSPEMYINFVAGIKDNEEYRIPDITYKVNRNLSRPVGIIDAG